MGKLLAEDDEAGRDGDGVGSKRCQPCSCERVCMLERSLEDARTQAVERDEGRGRRQPRAPVDDELRRDVPAGEEQSRREPERRSDREAGAPAAEYDCHGEKQRQPKGEGGWMR